MGWRQNIFEAGGRYQVIAACDIALDKVHEFRTGEVVIFCRDCYSHYDGLSVYLFLTSSGEERYWTLHDSEPEQKWKMYFERVENASAAYRRAVEFLNGLQVFGARFGLETARQLAASIGNPQDKLRFIHVAGTNGKGSTCAMLESIYRAAGLRVGLFTSPHLVSFRERIQVNRQLISEADVVRLVDELCEAVAAGVPPAVEPGVSPGGKTLNKSKREAGSVAGPGGMTPPSTSGGTPDATLFEFTTIMALRYFAEQKCDLVIWETGLGGRLDATNIVTPLVSVITNIGLDHQQWLGDTREKIAVEKAGIIKLGIPVATAATGGALEVIEQIARERNAPLKKAASSENIPPLPLSGEHQQINAALALATVEVLQTKLPVGEREIREGLLNVNWPGRMQLVTRASGQKILLDGAHNAEGAEVLRATLRNGEAFTLILGILGDKNCRAMCHILAPLAEKIFLVPVKSERTAAPAELAEICRQENLQAYILSCASLSEALEKNACESFVVIAGSLYLIGEAMELLQLGQAPERDEKNLNEWKPAINPGIGSA